MRARRLKTRRTQGSALILTVVLTSLLAIVGVLFLMTTRIDKLGSSAAADNERLTLAIDSVVAQISQVLADDVPGMSGGEDYYDYPDANNAWLAALEPNQVYNSKENEYRWPQITNLTGANPSRFHDVSAVIVGEWDPIEDPDSEPIADADGDGISDARWCRVPDVVTSRGRPIYAAVRIIDNGGMLNLNTAWANDAAWLGGFPGSPLDGSRQIQIGLTKAVGASAAGLWDARDPNKMGKLATRPTSTAYEDTIVWRYPPWPSNSPYTPFDISDELELRYRFVLNRAGVYCRAEDTSPLRDNTLLDPIGSGSTTTNETDWALRVMSRPATYDARYYALCHILTTYNMDRILTPNASRTPNRKLNVNSATVDALQADIAAALARRYGDAGLQDVATQIAVNLKDYIDDNNDVEWKASLTSASGLKLYGFERPCICLSEVAYSFARNAQTGQIAESTAVELCKPLFEDGDPPDDKWKIVVHSTAGSAEQLIRWKGDKRFHVMRRQNLLAPLLVAFDPNEAKTAAIISAARKGTPTDVNLAPSLTTATTIVLERDMGDGDWKTVDFVSLPEGFAFPVGDANDPNGQNGATRCMQRDITPGRYIKRLWSGPNMTPNLGNALKNYEADDPNLIQAWPANNPLTNIGELGMVFRANAYGVRSNDVAGDVLVDLSKSAFAELFNYLTVIDPAERGPLGTSGAETRIAGRINVNTAPWPVLAALPWIQYPSGTMVRAQAIVREREKRERQAYQSIGDMMVRVPELMDLQGDGRDNYTVVNAGDPQGPDLSRDDVAEDQEERDLLFTRFSDLVTVRSDVFTAYILVRLGEKGPQKRVIAILDRSQVSPTNPKVKVVALHVVADPR